MYDSMYVIFIKVLMVVGASGFLTWCFYKYIGAMFEKLNAKNGNSKTDLFYETCFISAMLDFAFCTIGSISFLIFVYIGGFGWSDGKPISGSETFRFLDAPFNASLIAFFLHIFSFFIIKAIFSKNGYKIKFWQTIASSITTFTLIHPGFWVIFTLFMII